MSPKPKFATRAEARLRAEIVLLALLRVAEHVIGVSHRLEALRGVGTRVHIGMQLSREPTVCLLDFFGSGTAVNAEYLVVVSQKSIFLSYSVPSSRDR